MAKRRKVSEDEEVFKEPEFDEVQFLKDEITKAKGIIVVFLLAIAVGFASAYLQVYGSVYLAWGLGILGAVSLKWLLPSMRIGFKDSKTWAFAIIAFLLIWISMWSVGLNPPFNDVSPPQVRVVEVYNGTAWVMIYSYQASFNAEIAKQIKKNKDNLNWTSVSKIRAEVTDNVKVAMVEINGDMATFKDGYYEVSVEPPISDIIITATDTSNHVTKLTVSK
ncbi:MAG: hypothetical protein GXO25_04450 [Euryarchaeota archaeon]|nr:hypothetical protein [Euryarchaeota archaeon]